LIGGSSRCRHSRRCGSLGDLRSRCRHFFNSHRFRFRYRNHLGRRRLRDQLGLGGRAWFGSWGARFGSCWCSGFARCLGCSSFGRRSGLSGLRALGRRSKLFVFHRGLGLRFGLGGCCRFGRCCLFHGHGFGADLGLFDRHWPLSGHGFFDRHRFGLAGGHSGCRLFVRGLHVLSPSRV